MDNVRVVEAPDQRVREFYEQQQLRDVAKNLAVPVNDHEVRQQLRANLLPAELPNETKDARRARLVDFLARKTLAEGQSSASPAKASVERRPSFREEGSPELFRRRKDIAEITERLRSAVHTPGTRLRWEDIELIASQSGFARPISSVKFMPSGAVCVGDWSGMLSVLGGEVTMPIVATAKLGVHICSVAARSKTVACGSLDGRVTLHAVRDGTSLEEAAVLEGHAARVSAVEFHALDSLLLSASHDRMWRLWDVEVGQCLLEQSGHTEAVQTLNASADGSLVASGGADRTIKIWDLRSGVLITTLRDHVAEVTSVAWNPARLQHTMELVSGSGDNRALVWDLRSSVKPKNVLFAHNSTITGLKYDEPGSVLVSSSLDGKVRFWDALDGYKLRKSLDTGSRIMGFDMRGQTLVAGRWDRLVDMYLDDKAL